MQIFNRWIFCICLLFVIAGQSPIKANGRRHDFHVSIVTADYNAQTGSLEITVKVFTDDLEKSILDLGGPALQLGSSTVNSEANALLFKYFQNRLQFWTGAKALTFDWLGFEVEMDATWCYLEIKNFPKTGKLKVVNRILFEQFEDQSNLMHFSILAFKKSLYLSRNDAEGNLEY